jgi:hypothetical protein
MRRGICFDLMRTNPRIGAANEIGRPGDLHFNSRPVLSRPLTFPPTAERKILLYNSQVSAYYRGSYAW